MKKRSRKECNYWYLIKYLKVCRKYWLLDNRIMVLITQKMKKLLKKRKKLKMIIFSKKYINRN